MVTSIGNTAVKDALEQAKTEVLAEGQKEMVRVFKAKLLEVQHAEVILKNLKRELADLEFELGEL